MKNFTEVLSEAKKMQKKMQEVQEKLKTIEEEWVKNNFQISEKQVENIINY